VVPQRSTVLMASISVLQLPVNVAEECEKLLEARSIGSLDLGSLAVMLRIFPEWSLMSFSGLSTRFSPSNGLRREKDGIHQNSRDPNRIAGVRNSSSSTRRIAKKRFNDDCVTLSELYAFFSEQSEPLWKRIDLPAIHGL